MQIRDHLRCAGVPAAFLLTYVCAQAQVELYEKHGPNGSRFGTAVARAGDLDRDGCEDFLVGAPQALIGTLSCGMAQVLSGKDGHVLFTYSSGVAGEEFGASVSPAGDVDHDGWSDVLIGAPGYDQDRGKVLIFSGKTGFALHLWTGQEQGSRFGAAIALIGLVNLDFYPDFAISAPFETVNGQPLWGMVRVYSGQSAAMIREITHSGTGSNWGFGLALAGNCDWDGDSRSDVLVGSPLYSNGGVFSGAAQVFSGATGGMLRSWIGSMNDQLGTSIDGLGDLDGDGRGELAIGSPGKDDNGFNAGKVFVYGIQHSAIPLFALDGVAGSFMGQAVSRLDDADGDDTPDLLVGWPSYSLEFFGKYGKATVHSGQDGSVIEAVFGTEVDSTFGHSLAWLRDVNGDGRDDYIVGAGLFDGVGSNLGQASVILGGATRPVTYCTAKTNSQGCEPSIGFTGAASLSVGDNFHVTAWDVLNKTPGIMLYGFVPSAKPFMGGTLCVGNPIVRTGVQFSGGSSHGVDCTGRYDFAFSHAYMSSRGFVAGLGVFCQYWSRDPGFAPPDNVGLTTGLHFVVLP